jgi:hypothetical protein
MHLHNEPYPNHLLCHSYDQAPDRWMRTFRLINRHTHTQQSHSPARKDSSNKNHCQVPRRALQNCSNQTNECADLNGEFPSKAIHSKPSHQGAEHGSAIKRRVNGSYDGRGLHGFEISEEVVGPDHVGHYSCIIAKQERTFGSLVSCQCIWLDEMLTQLPRI